jgi:hypothetical protein
MTIHLEKAQHQPSAADLAAFVARQMADFAHLQAQMAFQALNPIQDIVKQIQAQCALADAKLAAESQAMDFARQYVMRSVATTLQDVGLRIDQVKAAQLAGLDQVMLPKHLAQSALDSMQMSINRMLGALPIGDFDKIAQGLIGEAERFVTALPKADAAALKEVAADVTEAGSGLVSGLGRRVSDWWARADVLQQLMFFYALSIVVRVMVTSVQGVSNPAEGPSTSVLAPYGSPKEMMQNVLGAGLLGIVAHHLKRKKDAA